MGAEVGSGAGCSENIRVQRERMEVSGLAFQGRQG